MIYIEQTPGAPLNKSVQLLWYTRSRGPLTGRERILPSGRVQVMINLARDFIHACSESDPDSTLSPSLIVGARSVYEIVDRSDMAEMVGIVFRPGRFAAFASDSVDLFSNRAISLEDGWGSKARSLRDRLQEAPTPTAKLAELETFLMQGFGQQKDPHPIVEFALSSFAGKPLVSKVSDVAQDTGWSVRRFSQVFREAVGLSPKTWCRIQRFQRALGQLHEGAEVDWAGLALDCGYYDQSHFANEFRAFSGIDATSYCVGRTQWKNHVTT